MSGTQERLPETPGPVIETRTTTCYMCACRCGIRVTLRDGELRYIEGNPEHPINKGVICAKGASGAMKQVSPARLTRPLRRKAGAERGAGGIRDDLLGRGVRAHGGAPGTDTRERPAQVSGTIRTGGGGDP